MEKTNNTEEISKLLTDISNCKIDTNSNNKNKSKNTYKDKLKVRVDKKLYENKPSDDISIALRINRELNRKIESSSWYRRRKIFRLITRKLEISDGSGVRIDTVSVLTKAYKLGIIKTGYYEIKVVDLKELPDFEDEHDYYVEIIRAISKELDNIIKCALVYDLNIDSRIIIDIVQELNDDLESKIVEIIKAE